MAHTPIPALLERRAERDRRRNLAHMTLISVCVPVHRRHEPPNVHSLARSLPSALAGQSGELVIALNGVAEEPASSPVTTRVVDLGENRGVAAGWNAAARAAEGAILAFANDDTELGPGALAELTTALDSLPRAGVVGPLGMERIPRRFEHLRPAASETRNQPTQVSALFGFLMAVRREVYEAVGGFDERYSPCLWEEIDFGTAVRDRLGLLCYQLPGLAVRHEFGISARRSWPWVRVPYAEGRPTLRAIRHRNRRLYASKWGEQR
jgi:GT2 family glycosyltransferase